MSPTSRVSEYDVIRLRSPWWMCPHPACTRRRARRQTRSLRCALSQYNAMMFCSWHLEEANRETPPERRLRILAEHGS